MENDIDDEVIVLFKNYDINGREGKSQRKEKYNYSDCFF